MTIPFTFLKQYWQAISLLLLLAITVLSLYPLDSLPPVPGSDKTHHFIAYGSLMFPVAFRRPKYWLLIGLFFMLWSGGIELIQPYVNRHGEWLDMAANTAGLFCGYLAAQLVSYFTPEEVNAN